MNIERIKEKITEKTTERLTERIAEEKEYADKKSRVRGFAADAFDLPAGTTFYEGNGKSQPVEGFLPGGRPC